MTAQHHLIAATFAHLIRMEESIDVDLYGRLTSPEGYPYEGHVVWLEDAFQEPTVVVWAGPEVDPDHSDLALASV
jgi:hypothetical protein